MLKKKRGSVQFSKSTLTKLIEMDANIVGVCTLKNSSFNADHVDLTELCDENNILPYQLSCHQGLTQIQGHLHLCKEMRVGE